MTANRTSTGITQFVRALRTRGCADQTDGQLLSQFLSRRDEAAFVALVRRHGPMVLGVCRRILGNAADAEDAFQATFLVLVRKAPSLTARAVLGDWLHGVARRTALNARRAEARRRAKEEAMARPDGQGEATPDDWLPFLDEELSRLPENYRLPVVLCDLEGKTRREAAEHLGWPEGTVAGRLARGRALLARRLGRHGVAVSGGALAAVLSENPASACVSEALLHSTARAASLLAAGTEAATAVISARVVALSEGVVRAMFLAKLKTATCALALTILVGLGGAALAPGTSHLPAAGAATAPQGGGDARPDAQAPKLVRQLGSPDFAKRQAAEKALTDLGARAAASVRAGMNDADAEVVRRCAAIWPRLWQTEIARPDADRLAGYTHPLWARFRKAAGDDPGSRTLFAEMAADVDRFSRLEAAEADPEKAGAAYAAELKRRVEALARGYQEAETAARGRTGEIWPAGGIPTRGEFVALLFLGTYPATAAVTFPEKDDSARFSHNNVFSLPLHPRQRGKDAAIPPALRRLFAAWLGVRTDPRSLEMGMNLAVSHNFAEVASVAVAHAANAKTAPRVRGFALLAVGRFGSADDLPLLEKAFADDRVFHSTNYTSETGQQRPVEVRVSDAAVAAALRLAGQHPADFGFTFLEMYKERGPDTLAKYHLLGFFDDEARQAAHKRAREWLDKHRKELVSTPVATGAASGKEPPPPAQPKIDVTGAGETAMELVKTTKDPDARWMAIRILGNLRYERAVPLLLESLSDPHHYVRANAARALGDMKVVAAAKPLTDLLRKEKDGGVLQQTSLALANLRCADALPALKGAAKHEDVQTRMWILQAVGRLGGKGDVPFLAGYLEDPSQSVQVSAAQAIEHLTGADFGFPGRSGPSSPDEGLRRARAWWEEHQGAYRRP